LFFDFNALASILLPSIAELIITNKFFKKTRENINTENESKINKKIKLNYFFSPSTKIKKNGHIH
jgi:hypothetical protein